MTKRMSSLADSELSRLLKSGAVGVIPTDTVYGLVAQASNEAAISRLYRTKFRESPPGTLIGATSESFINLGFNQDQITQVATYWPAPLSVVLDASGVPHYLKQDRDSLPVRIPDIEDLRALLRETGPLMTTSANAPKQPTSTAIEMAMEYFGDSIDFYVDGGNLSHRPSSSIVGFEPDGSLTVYREGAFDTSTLT
jgi:L-threonylcarbamoyladenylate synthase